MWNCPECGGAVDDADAACTFCGNRRPAAKPEPEAEAGPVVIALACPRCQGEMEEGFVRDMAHGAQLPSEWVAGAPQWSMWFGLRTSGKERHRVETYRCTRCGYLESYAAAGPWSSR